MGKRPRLMDAVSNGSSKKKKQQQQLQPKQKQSNPPKEIQNKAEGGKKVNSTLGKNNDGKIQQTQRVTVPFGRGDSILLVGEGELH